VDHLHHVYHIDKISVVGEASDFVLLDQDLEMEDKE
jgi:hypothetical protein